MQKVLNTNPQRTLLCLTLGAMVVLGHGEVSMSQANAIEGVEERASHSRRVR